MNFKVLFRMKLKDKRGNTLRKQLGTRKGGALDRGEEENSRRHRNRHRNRHHRLRHGDRKIGEREGEDEKVGLGWAGRGYKT
jgi:hypothetical protein